VGEGRWESELRAGKWGRFRQRAGLKTLAGDAQSILAGVWRDEKAKTVEMEKPPVRSTIDGKKMEARCVWQTEPCIDESSSSGKTESEPT
jgi:hypothetical protein